MTASNLRSAYGGESQAYQRYVYWGNIAAKENFPNIGRLFKGIAYAEQVHAGNHFNELEDVEGDFLVASMAGFGAGPTSKNLEGAIAGENFEIHEMYSAFTAVAELQQEKGALQSFRYALEAEKNHSELFSKAKEHAEQGKDLARQDIQVCEVCGHTKEGSAPDRCPTCNAPSNKFKQF
ncbi:MAG: rubrerythrin family protein [Clostridia bacterium]|jgi:rubrerythrin|nr:rubrerythrin family protein [Clostridia bacterium]